MVSAIQKQIKSVEMLNSLSISAFLCEWKLSGVSTFSMLADEEAEARKLIDGSFLGAQIVPLNAAGVF